MTSEEGKKCLGKYHFSVLKEIKLDNESNEDNSPKSIAVSFALRRGGLPFWKNQSVAIKQVLMLTISEGRRIH